MRDQLQEAAVGATPTMPPGIANQLAYGTVAKWLLDCPLDFSTGDPTKRYGTELLDSVMELPTEVSERVLPSPGDLRQFVGWAILGEESRAVVAATADGRPLPDAPIVRFNPSWSRVVDLGVGLSLAEWMSTGRLTLTSRGKDTAAALWAAEGVLEVESGFLIDLSVSQAMFDRLPLRAIS